jgi:hypothetical protein
MARGARLQPLATDAAHDDARTSTCGVRLFAPSNPQRLKALAPCALLHMAAARMSTRATPGRWTLALFGGTQTKNNMTRLTSANVGVPFVRFSVFFLKSCGN